MICRVSSTCISILSSINRNILRDAKTVPMLCTTCVLRRNSNAFSLNLKTNEQLLSSKIYLVSGIKVRGKKNWRGLDKVSTYKIFSLVISSYFNNVFH